MNEGRFMGRKKIIPTLCLLVFCNWCFADFTIGFIPDTQNLSETDEGGQLITEMNQFFVDNKEKLNVIFVASLGDMAQGYPRNGDWDDMVARPAEMVRVKEAYSVYISAGIPFAACQGNHDPISAMNEWFPVSDFEGTPTWGGSMNGGIENAYYLFEADGMKFILVVLQYDPPSKVLNWANSIFEKYSGRRGILVTHRLTPVNSSEVQTQVIEQNDNIFMAVAGHNCQQWHWTSKSPSGNEQHNFIFDLQCKSDGGATVRYYTFKTNENEIDMRTYNIPTEVYYTANDCDCATEEGVECAEFSYAYDMKPLNIVTGSPASLELRANSAALLNDQSTATVKATIRDASGHVVRDVTDPIVFSVSPGGTITGPASVAPKNGKASTKVTLQTGAIRITGSVSGITGSVDIMPLVNLIDFRNRRSIELQKPILVAHRGGVITEKTPECSLAAIHLAKRQGYVMVELDVQRSRDGIPIVFHDSDLKEACGIDNRIANMNSKRIAEIKFLQTDQEIITLDRALEECLALSLGVMLDVKVRDDEPFYQTIANLIKKYKYESSTITISNDPALRKCFEGVVMLTVTSDEFRRVQQGETVDLSGKYWFGLPHQIPDNTVKRLRQNGAYVIPAINTFRYPTDNHYELAREDINRLIRAGVEGFQIDSVYRPLLSQEKVAADASFSLKLLWTRTYNDHGEGAMTSNIESCEFSPDGTLFAAGCGDGRVLIITVPQGDIYRELNIATGRASDRSKDREVECIAWTKNGKYLAAAGNKHIPAVIIDIENNRIIETLFDNGGDKDGMDMSHHGRYLAIADIDHVRVYGTENWRQIVRFNPLNDRSNNSIDFSRDDSFMVVAGNKGRVAIVTVPDWKVERVLHTDQLNNDYPKNAWGKPSWWVKSTRISPDQQYVAYGVSSGSAFTWKRDGILIKELPIHTYVEAVSFSPNGKVMVVGGNDQDTWTEYEQPQRFYSVPDFDLIMEFVTPGENCEYIDWSPDSKYMVQPSTSGNIMLFEANWNLTGE